MPLANPAPSLCLRAAQALHIQVSQQLADLVAVGPSHEQYPDLVQLQTSFTVLLDTLTLEIQHWQQLALTLGNLAVDTMHAGRAADPLLLGYLCGSAEVRAGEDLKPLTKAEAFSIESWWPVKRS